VEFAGEASDGAGDGGDVVDAEAQKTFTVCEILLSKQMLFLRAKVTKNGVTKHGVNNN
jgi:hypothetical protein